MLSTLEMIPMRHPLSATVRMPGSKSLTNRALLLASLADGTSHLTNALFCDDSRYFANALLALGFDLKMDAARSEMTIQGHNGSIPARRAELFIGNAGTAARFLTAFLTLGDGEFLLDGEPRMRQRPINDLAIALRQLGARLETTSSCPPVKVTASGLPGGLAEVSGNISSQFLSALLMVAPYAKESVEIKISGELKSKPYVDMTVDIMQDFGVKVQRQGYESFVIAPARYQVQESYIIESDATAASYFFAAAAVCGGKVRVGNISRISKQGDIAFLDVLAEMGCAIREGSDYVEVEGSHSLRGVDRDLSDLPDTAQTLAAIAPFASTPTRIRGIASARLKETDRVQAVCTELGRLGVRVEEHSDGMTIQPCAAMRPANIQTYNDHRMAMAFSLIGLRVSGITIENPGCVSKTFPTYFEVLEMLR